MNSKKEHEMKLYDAPFELIKSGKKTIEVRCNDEKRRKLNVGDKIIFYSLGNFIFDTDYQRSQFNTELGLLVKLNFTENEFSFEPIGLKIVRGDEHIVKAELPRIFVDVNEEEYNLLATLSAKVLVSATKRQMTYLNPQRFKNATEEEWQEHFKEPLRTGKAWKMDR